MKYLSSDEREELLIFNLFLNREREISYFQHFYSIWREEILVWNFVFKLEKRIFFQLISELKWGNFLFLNFLLIRTGKNSVRIFLRQKRGFFFSNWKRNFPDIFNILIELVGMKFCLLILFSELAEEIFYFYIVAELNGINLYF